MSSASPAHADASTSPPAGASFAWHGWRLRLPEGWNPVKLEGDAAEGYAAFADLHKPRLGLRWKTPGRKDVEDAAAADWATRAMRDEVGKIEADRAKAFAMPDAAAWRGSLVHVDDDPPGRDVWVAYSAASGRIVQLSQPVERRKERLLTETILPTLADTSPDDPQAWAVFELSCSTPPGFKLRTHRLNAGDLGLSLADGKRSVTVRQVAVASLALKRMPLDRWIAEHRRAEEKHYKPAGAYADVEVEAEGGRSLVGRSRRWARRRRFVWMRWLPEAFVTLALHDEPRDRLVIVHATDDDLARRVAGTVGGTTPSVPGRARG